jgi:hypothetical protein
VGEMVGTKVGNVVGGMVDSEVGAVSLVLLSLDVVVTGANAVQAANAITQIDTTILKSNFLFIHILHF